MGHHHTVHRWLTRRYLAAMSAKRDRVQRSAPPGLAVAFILSPRAQRAYVAMGRASRRMAQRHARRRLQVYRRPRRLWYARFAIMARSHLRGVSEAITVINDTINALNAFSAKGPSTLLGAPIVTCDFTRD